MLAQLRSGELTVELLAIILGEVWGIPAKVMPILSSICLDLPTNPLIVHQNLVLSVMWLLFAFRDLWKEWGDSNFQIFSQNCQFHHRRMESLEHFNVLLYIIMGTTVSYLRIPYYFYRSPVFFHFVYISIFSQVHFAGVLCI